MNFELKTALECLKRIYMLKPYQIFKVINIDGKQVKTDKKFRFYYLFIFDLFANSLLNGSRKP